MPKILTNTEWQTKWEGIYNIDDCAKCDSNKNSSPKSILKNSMANFSKQCYQLLHTKK